VCERRAFWTLGDRERAELERGRGFDAGEI
jgi:hypothetical protein